MSLENDFASIGAAEFIPWEKLRQTTVLITGATGLIGYTLTGALLYADRKYRLGMTVLALVRDESRARERFGEFLAYGGSLRFVEGTVEELPKIPGPVDYILHGASQTASAAFVRQPVETIRTSVLGTMRLLELAREKHTKGVVYLSSMEVYGHPQRGHKVDEADACTLLPLQVRSSYPVSKAQCENLCCAYASEYGVPAMIVRLTQTFGPGGHPEDTRIFAEIANCVRKRQDIVLHTRCDTERSYLYTVDAATAILTVLLKGRPGEAYNAADERTYCSLADIAQKAAAASGITVRFELEDEKKHGYPKPVYMDLDTGRLRGLGWYVKSGEMIDNLLRWLAKAGDGSQDPKGRMKE